VLIGVTSAGACFLAGTLRVLLVALACGCVMVFLLALWLRVGAVPLPLAPNVGDSRRVLVASCSATGILCAL
jgi:hypothetical protein